MVPVCRPLHLATERVRSGDADIGLGADEGTDGTDHEACGDDRTVAGEQVPESGVVPLFPFDVGVEADTFVDTEAFSHIDVILLDLVALGKKPAPLRVSCEGVLVGEGRNVHPQARIVVLMPATAHVIGPFQQHDVADTGLQ
ncbi:Uncharacterised protein [Mycobacteroides abscessus subsp. massiliense]|nr:Uncharacterised protein [Mycobacteroides abscessus subsp. massiliense]